MYYTRFYTRSSFLVGHFGIIMDSPPLNRRYVVPIVKLSKQNLASTNDPKVEYLGNTGIYENAVVKLDQPAAHRIGEWSELP